MSEEDTISNNNELQESVSSVNLDSDNDDNGSSFAEPQAPNEIEQEVEEEVVDTTEIAQEEVEEEMAADEHPVEDNNNIEEGNGQVSAHEDVSEHNDDRIEEASQVSHLDTTTHDDQITTTSNNIQSESNHIRNVSTTSTTITSNAKSTLLLVKTTLEEIVDEKEVKKIAGTHKIIQRTITKIDETLKQSNSSSIEVDSILLFEALRAASRTKSSRITSKALDTLSKLFSFRAIDEAILVNPPDSMASNDQNETNDNSGITPPPKQRLIDAAIDAIADCFQGEGTDERVELQIIRSLSGCILVEDASSLCHGASLLKAIRTIYNIFVFSLNPTNQGIAQATLTQIITATYDKIEVKKLQPFQVSINESKKSLSDGTQEEVVGNDPLTLQNMENLNDEEERRMDAQQYDNVTEDEHVDQNASERDLAIKDAFLVFRAMSKICAKPLESELDMRSHAVRSKLLSLHIIYSIIKDHIDIFLSPDVVLPGKEPVSLMNAVRQYLCLSLSRNAASPISPVFEITLEIMWLIIANLRADMVKEIPVFLTEIYFPITELTTATSQQKRYFLTVIQRICNDPRTLIEFYLNYDCNPGMPNIMEIMVDYLTKLALTRVDISPTQRSYYEEQLTKPLSTFNFNELPLLTTSTLPSSIDPNQIALLFPVEFALKMTALNCIISILRSLGSWAHKALNPNANIVNPGHKVTGGLGQSAEGSNTNTTLTLADDTSASESNININNQLQDVDDPTQFENLKQRKTELSDSIAIFNNKPKRAIPGLITKGFIKDDSPASIAKWLLDTDGLDLTVVGDYLGEGDEKNIAIMHAFVEQFDFTGLSIVDALRDFLQAFRLPGEGQKIDRFMLKFAERFVEQNPGVFSKADTAYVLSYSLIMLNTDLHSSQIKRKMTLEEFLDNNRGIDNGNDLPEEFLVGLFKEIENNEIKLLSEQHQAMLSEDNTATIGTVQPQSAFNFFSSRDLARESYLQVSKEISSKTELVFKNLSKSKGKQDTEVYYAASHFEHVKSIFETLWMSFLAALTPPFKDYDDIETTNKCLEGLKISIKISAIFVLDDARKSFIGALVQFCNLQNVQEIKVKNVNAMIDLLEIALAEGNYLKDSWKDVILVVSQMERLQLISKGIDRDTVPDVAQARLANPRASLESTRSTTNQSIFDIWGKRATPIELAQEKYHNQKLSGEMSKFISSSDLVVLMDNIFTKSSDLSGSAIIDFIKALTDVSLDEIESSQYASTPRMFSLQKMIDVCYYNMDRIRLEWTPLWAVMGNAFNKIATNPNLAIVFFAIDSLRQLSMRFLDIDELSGFEFQSDFLKPFEYAVQNTTNTEVQEMIIECFRNFILTKQQRIKSGWKPILESLQYTAASKDEKIVLKTQQLVGDDIVSKNFESVFGQEGAFFELVGIFKEITKNKKYQKAALHALESLKKITEQIANICFSKDVDQETKDHYEQLLRGKDIFQDIWFPMLYCFNDTIMTAEDLEVRSRALNYMFDSLVAYGGEFDDAFWEKICTKLLFPIFGVLSKHWEVNQFNSHDELSVWLSTTLIQALRNLIALFTHYFDSLSGLLDGFLDLLVSCICQENDTIARIGRSCLQELILQNVDKFNETHWEHIGEVFNKLFHLTTANELFDNDPLRQGRHKSVTETNPETQEGTQETVERAHAEEGSEDVGGDNTEQETTGSGTVPEVKPTPREEDTHDSHRRRINIKNSIVVKCVLQLLMIELLNELYEDENFARCVPYKESIKLTELLEQSYAFARDFNADYGLRTRLVEARVVDKIPNLLKQETSAAAVLIDIMFKLYFNGDNEDNNTNGSGSSNKDSEIKNEKLLERLVNICTGVVTAYIGLDDRTMERSINSWRPVIVEILQGYYELDDEDFRHYCSAMYTLVIEILDKSVPQDLRYAVKLFLSRVGSLYLDTEKSTE